MTYNDAVDALGSAERRGLLVRRGSGYRPAPAICPDCISRAEAEASRSHQTMSSDRDPIPAQLRFRILQRDGFRCRYCGRSSPDGAVLHVDHVIPFSAGGPTTEDNLMTSCEQCNLGKSASTVI